MIKFTYRRILKGVDIGVSWTCGGENQSTQGKPPTVEGNHYLSHGMPAAGLEPGPQR